MNLFDTMKTAPILDYYSGSSYASKHETFSLTSEERDGLPHPTAFIFGGITDEEVEHGDYLMRSILRHKHSRDQ